MAGNFNSGRRRTKRPTTADAVKLDATAYAKANGGEVVTVTLDNGAQHKRARCKCGKAARFFYKYAGRIACRECLGLGSARRFQSRAQRAARRPEALGIALKDASEWLDGIATGRGDNRKFSNVMGTLNTLNQDDENRINAEAAQNFAELQARVIVSDVTTASDLMARIEQIIASGDEDKVTRKGEPISVPLSVDSLSKLFHAWSALSNLRAARSGIATNISESRNSKEDSSNDFRETIKKAMVENGWKAQNGMTMQEIAERRAALALPSKP